MINPIAASILNKERNKLVHIGFSKVISLYSRPLKVVYIPSKMILHEPKTAV